jgi:hypothetical protein
MAALGVILAIWCWKIIVNAGINSIRHRHLRVCNCLSTASAFRNQGQSGTAGHWLLVRRCPAMLLMQKISLVCLVPIIIEPYFIHTLQIGNFSKKCHPRKFQEVNSAKKAPLCELRWKILWYTIMRQFGQVSLHSANQKYTVGVCLYWMSDTYLQCFGSWSGFNKVIGWLDLDLDSGSGSGSRRVKTTHKILNKNLRKFMLWSAGCSLLSAEGFCSLDVLYEGLNISKLPVQFLIKKYEIFFSCNFLKFSVIKTLDPDWSQP